MGSEGTLQHLFRLDGASVERLKQFFQISEHISSSDVDGIVRDAASIFSRCVRADSEGEAKGLIYGHIQSGKTAIILMVMAIAADNGYKHFVVCTSDLNDLYSQTLERIKRSLDRFQVLGKLEIRRFQGDSTSDPCVLVASKNVRVLRDVGRVIRDASWDRDVVMMIDDEADQASLNTQVNQPWRNASGVNAAMSDFRNLVPTRSFLQTTATPQSLLLQDATADFHPDFVVVTHPGQAYCGGDLFFVNENFDEPTYLRFVPFLDVQSLVQSHQIPETCAFSICAFFIGAAILRLSGESKNYTYLLHTSFRQDDHLAAAYAVEQFCRKLVLEMNIAQRAGLSKADETTIALLHRAYQQVLERRFSFDKVLSEMAAAGNSFEVIEINSRTGEGVRPDPSRRHTLYVGGAKIGRGVTVTNLLVTYYGRDAQNPQIDTVLQHARMYGYRRRELAVTRIFLPESLAIRFRQIHIADNALRRAAGESSRPIAVLPIPLRGLRPTRASVLNRTTVELNTYLGGSEYFPISPICDGSLGRQTEMIDRLLPASEFPAQQPIGVTLDTLLALLDFRFSLPDAPGSWNDELIRRAVGLARTDGSRDEATVVVVNRRSRISRGDSRVISAVLPGNAGSPPYGINTRKLALLMTRLAGDVENGWLGMPFWVPLIRFPDGNYAYALNRSQ